MAFGPNCSEIGYYYLIWAKGKYASRHNFQIHVHTDILAQTNENVSPIEV